MKSIYLIVLNENKKFKLKVNISSRNLTCKSLTEIIIKRLVKLNKLQLKKAENYGLFCCGNGIEQLLNDTDNIVDKIDSNKDKLILRKKSSVEINPMQHLSSKTRSKIKSFYSNNFHHQHQKQQKQNVVPYHPYDQIEETKLIENYKITEKIFSQNDCVIKIKSLYIEKTISFELKN